MDRKNQQGQILVEVTVVMLFIIMIFFVGLSHLSNIKSENQKYQFKEKRGRHVR